MMKTDYHIHTNYSDGQNSLQEMIEESIKLGLSSICIVDHVRNTTTWLDAYMKDISNCKNIYKENIKINVGVETKVIDWNGNLDLPYINSDYNLDIVAAIHRIPDGNGNYIDKYTITDDIEYSKQCYLNTLNGLKNNEKITKLAHPFSLFKVMKISMDDTEWWGKVLKCFLESDYLIEYNPKYDNSMVPKYIWKSIKNRLVFGSDSHSKEEIQMRIKNYETFDNIVKGSE